MTDAEYEQRKKENLWGSKQVRKMGNLFILFYYYKWLITFEHHSQRSGQRTTNSIYEKNVAMEIADMSFQGSMARGDVLHRTYPSVSASTIPSIYTRDTDVTFRDITDTDETLTVNRQFIIPFYLDDFDSIQNNYDAAAMYGRNFGIALQSQVDADVLGEVLNAWSVVDAGDVWGTTGQGISLTTSNVLQTITTCTKSLTSLMYILMIE